MSKSEIKAFATLLTNLGKKKRSENLLKIAKDCVYLKKMNNNSWAELAKKIKINDERAHISSEMLREFGAILELPDEVKQLIEKDLITSVDAAYRISRLRQKEDQISLAKSTAQNKLSASDVRAIIEYKTQNPDVTMEQAIERVLKSKSKVVTHHIVILELSQSTSAALSKEAEKSKQKPENLALAIIGKEWNKDWILSFGMRGNDIILKLSEVGFKGLQEEARIKGIKLKDLAENLMRNTFPGSG